MTYFLRFFVRDARQAERSNSVRKYVKHRSSLATSVQQYPRKLFVTLVLPISAQAAVVRRRPGSIVGHHFAGQTKHIPTPKIEGVHGRAKGTQNQNRPPRQHMLILLPRPCMSIDFQGCASRRTPQDIRISWRDAGQPLPLSQCELAPQSVFPSRPPHQTRPPGLCKFWASLRAPFGAVRPDVPKTR